MSSSKQRWKGIARFVTRSCRACGQLRQAGWPCDACGAKPKGTEVDPHVVKRQQRLRILIPMLEEAAAALQNEVAAPAEVWDDFDEAILTATPSAISAMGRFVDGTGTSAECVDAIRPLLRLEQIYRNPAPRPRRNEGVVRHAILASLMASLRLALDASALPRMGDVERMARQSQQALDDATARIDEMMRLRRARGEAENASLSALVRDYTDSSRPMLSLAAHPAARPQGWSVSAAGAEAVEWVGSAVAAALFDQASFDRVQAYGLTVLDRPELKDVLDDPDWIQRAQTCIEKSIFQNRELTRLFADPTADDFELVSGLMSFVEKLREVRLRHVLALMLRVSGEDIPPGGFGKNARAGTWIKKTNERWPDLGLNDLLSEELRHIAAHQDYAVEDGLVVAHVGDEQHEQRWSMTEFVDSMLTHLELVTALENAMAVAAAKHECTPPLTSTAKNHILEESLTVNLTLLGVPTVRVTRSGTTVTAEVRHIPANTATIIAGAAGSIPDNFDTLVLRCENSVVQAALPPFRDYANRDDSQDELFLAAQACAAVTIDGRPAPPPGIPWDDLLCGLAFRGERLEPHQAVPYLKQVGAMARTVDDTTSRDYVNRALARIRSGSDTTPNQPGIPTAFTRAKH